MKLLASTLLLIGAVLAVPTAAPVKRTEGPPAYTDKAFQTYYGAYINDYREQHNAPPVKYKKKYATYAYNTASTWAKTHTGSSYGETIYYEVLDDGYPDWEQYTYDAIDYWMSFEDVYVESAPKKAKWYTQTVWKAHTWIGCAWSPKPDTDGYYYFYCEYDPKGNVPGEYADNVGSDDG